jgi:RimJ/RimL family protein N-acetyltransferase
LNEGERTITVRRAVPGDSPELVAIFKAVARERVFIYTERVSDDQIERMKKRLVDKKSLVAVAEAGGRVVGMLSLVRYDASKAAHLRNLGISVRRGYRGIGVGRALMDYAIKWARSNKVRKITLGVFSSNPNAIRLYKKFGFEVEGRLEDQFFISGEFVDELLMGLRIAP